MEPYASLQRPRLERAVLWPALRRPSCHVTLVVGPPGSGKTTWCAQQQPPFDSVIDLDVLIAECAGLPLYERRSVADLELGLLERNRRLTHLASMRPEHRAAVIVGAPGWQFRWWRDALRPQRVQIQRATFSESDRRLRADPQRRSQLERHLAALAAWWQIEQQYLMRRQAANDRQSERTSDDFGAW